MTGAPSFISRRIKSGGALVTVLVAISFFIVIIAFCVAGGFRKEVYSGMRALYGDILLAPAGFDYPGGTEPVRVDSSLVSSVLQLRGVRQMRPFVSRGGIVRKDGNIHGVIVKGVEDSGMEALHACIPGRLARLMGLSAGERMTVWFVGDDVKARNFTVDSMYEPLASTDENLTVLVPLADMQRLCGWGRDSVSAFEVMIADETPSRMQLSEISAMVGIEALCADEPMFASSVPERWPQIFDWLDLVDSNVLVVLLLMMLVAGFNMVSAMLILMFRNISTIGMLKTMGMTDRGISAVFLRLASVLALKGMIAGDAAALLFLALQKHFHLIRLNPQNYYVSSVPVSMDPALPLLSNIAVYAAVMLFTLLPCLFISRVDPARTVRLD